MEGESSAQLKDQFRLISHQAPDNDLVCGVQMSLRIARIRKGARTGGLESVVAREKWLSQSTCTILQGLGQLAWKMTGLCSNRDPNTQISTVNRDA